MTTIEIRTLTDETELFRRYQGQSEPQPCYIEIGTKDGIVLADYDSEIGGGKPGSVHHGIDRRYTIPLLNATAANALLNEIAPLAQRIVDGTTTDWNGRNTVAVLDQDARAAEADLMRRLGLAFADGDEVFPEDDTAFDTSDLVTVWDVDDVTNGEEAEEYGITAATTDERLDEIAAQITADMAACTDATTAVVDGLDNYLRELRDQAASA